MPPRASRKAVPSSGSKSPNSPRTQPKKQHPKEPCKPPLCFGDALYQIFKPTNENKENCLICHHPIVYGAIAKCPERWQVCWLCEVRWRLLLVSTSAPSQEEPRLRVWKCLVCANANNETLLTRDKNEVLDVRGWGARGLSFDPDTCIYFADEEIARAYREIKEARCWFPDCRPRNTVYASLNQLKDHWKETHKRVLCDVCYEARHAHQFVAEHPLYEVQDLNRHRNQGDRLVDRPYSEEQTSLAAASNKQYSSLVIVPHVWCRACEKYYLDEQEFEMHWRGADNHFRCRLCHDNGLSSRMLFATYNELWDHHSKSHYPCTLQQCQDQDQVFYTENELQLHMAKVHLTETSIYQNDGKGRIRVNLYPEAPIRQVNHDKAETRQRLRNRERASGSLTAASSGFANDGQPSLYAIETATSWPIEMTAEADEMAKIIRQTVEGFINPKELFSQMLDKYRLEKKEFWDDQSEGYQRDVLLECKKLQMATKPEAVDFSVNFLIRSFHSQQQLNKARSQDISSRVFPTLTQAASLLCLLALSVPPSKSDIRDAIITSILKVARNSAQTRKLLEDEAKREHDYEERLAAFGLNEEMDGDEGVLEKCDFLPFMPSVNFVEAIEWALKEYLRIAAPEAAVQKSNPDIPLKVPQIILLKMRTSYNRLQLEQFQNLDRDLNEFISTRNLEKFVQLYPEFRNLISQYPKKLPGQSEWKDHRRKAADIGRQWGRACDQVFKELTSRQLLLLKDYVSATRSLLPSAMEPRDDLRSGVETEALLQSSRGAPQRGVERQYLRSATGKMVCEDDEDFPALGGNSIPHAATTSLGSLAASLPSSEVSRRGKSNAPPPQAKAASWRSAPPHRDVDIGPALGAGVTRANANWGSHVVCWSCQTMNKASRQSCVKCRTLLTSKPPREKPQMYSSASDFPDITTQTLPSLRR